MADRLWAPRLAGEKEEAWLTEERTGAAAVWMYGMA